jgi:hypothetical protein
MLTFYTVNSQESYFEANKWLSEIENFKSDTESQHNHPVFLVGIYDENVKKQDEKEEEGNKLQRENSMIIQNESRIKTLIQDGLKLPVITTDKTTNSLLSSPSSAMISAISEDDIARHASSVGPDPNKSWKHGEGAIMSKYFKATYIEIRFISPLNLF